jgi:peptidoglycan/LPS O-acetylase OafA/YrhL
VLIACLVFGSLILTPQEFTQLSKHSVSGAGFYANFTFWQESGYFDSSNESKPLLNLWSLGVEEQFYLFWPVVLIAATKARLHRLPLTAILVVASFALSVLIARSSPSASFYLPHTRMWEPLVGALLACLPVSTSSKSFLGVPTWTLKNVASGIGITFIVMSAAGINGSQSYSGWLGLLPTIGAALIIYGGESAWINRQILSCSVLLQFGLISYALYLWHWPILTFSRLMWGGAMPANMQTVAVMVSILMAGLSFQFIEKPTRNGRNLGFKSVAFIGLMSVVIGIGLLGQRDGSLPFKLTDGPANRIDGVLGHDAFNDYIERTFQSCTASTEVLKRLTACKQSLPSSPHSIALLGDSHAAHLSIGLAEALPKTNVVLYGVSGGSYIKLAPYKAVVQSILDNRQISAVIVAFMWDSNLNGQELRETLETLVSTGKSVYIVDDVPSFSFDPVNCKFARWAGQKATCDEDQRLSWVRLTGYLPALELATSGNPHVKLLNVRKYLCDSSNCYMAKDNVLLYRDNNHLTIEGSRFVGSQIVKDHPGLAWLLP